MVSIFLMIVSLLFNSHSADAAPHVQKDITYDGCNQPPNPWRMNPSLDKNGHLAVDIKNLSVRSNIKSEDKEVIKTSSPFYAVTGTKTRTFYMDYELNRDDDKPQSLKVTTYALETPNINTKKSAPLFVPQRVENKTIFGYKDGNCYVAQITLKVGDEPEKITYDRALCDKILRVAKAGMKKMEQCKAGFEQIKSAIKEYNDAAQKNGGQLSELFTGALQDDSKSSPYKAWSSLNTDLNSIFAVSTCHGVRSAYTYDKYDPDTVMDLPDSFPFTTNMQSLPNSGNAYAPMPETKPAK